MANNFGTSVWRIDTASANPVQQTAGFASRRALVSAIEFSGYTAGATDSAVITGTDAQGNTFTFLTLQGLATKENVGTKFGKPVWIMGLAVPTLSTGQVAIYLA